MRATLSGNGVDPPSSATAAAAAEGAVEFADLPPAEILTASGNGVDPPSPSDENGMDDSVSSVPSVGQSFGLRVL